MRFVFILHSHRRSGGVGHLRLQRALEMKSENIDLLHNLLFGSQTSISRYVISGHFVPNAPEVSLHSLQVRIAFRLP